MSHPHSKTVLGSRDIAQFSEAVAMQPRGPEFNPQYIQDLGTVTGICDSSGGKAETGGSPGLSSQTA